MIFHLSGVWAIAINIAVWLVIHAGVGLSTARMRPNSFNPESWLYRERAWERDGRIYKSLLKIKRWKRLLPDGVAVFKGGFRNRRFESGDTSYVQAYVVETCRAEYTHWLILVFSLIFFLWNEWWIGMIMVAYGCLANIPCILAQRYNRIRLKRIRRRLIRSR